MMLWREASPAPRLRDRACRVEFSDGMHLWCHVSFDVVTGSVLVHCLAGAAAAAAADDDNDDDDDDDVDSNMDEAGRLILLSGAHRAGSTGPLSSPQHPPALIKRCILSCASSSSHTLRTGVLLLMRHNNLDVPSAIKTAKSLRPIIDPIGM